MAIIRNNGQNPKQFSSGIVFTPPVENLSYSGHVT